MEKINKEEILNRVRSLKNNVELKVNNIKLRLPRLVPPAIMMAAVMFTTNPAQAASPRNDVKHKYDGTTAAERTQQENEEKLWNDLYYSDIDYNKMSKNDYERAMSRLMVEMNEADLNVADAYAKEEIKAVREAKLTEDELNMIVKYQGTQTPDDRDYEYVKQSYLYTTQLWLRSMPMVRTGASAAEFNAVDRDGNNEFMAVSINNKDAERDVRKEANVVRSQVKKDWHDYVKYAYDYRRSDGEKMAQIIVKNLELIEKYSRSSRRTTQQEQLLQTLISETAGLLPYGEDFEMREKMVKAYARSVMYEEKMISKTKLHHVGFNALASLNDHTAVGLEAYGATTVKDGVDALYGGEWNLKVDKDKNITNEIIGGAGVELTTNKKGDKLRALGKIGAELGKGQKDAEGNRKNLNDLLVIGEVQYTWASNGSVEFGIVGGGKFNTINQKKSTVYVGPVLKFKDTKIGKFNMPIESKVKVGGTITKGPAYSEPELPNTEEPNTEEPNTEEPGTEQPGTEEPGTEQPGTEQPGTEQPGTEQPGTEQPGTEQPGTEQPGTEQPGNEATDIPVSSGNPGSSGIDTTETTDTSTTTTTPTETATTTTPAETTTTTTPSNTTTTTTETTTSSGTTTTPTETTTPTTTVDDEIDLNGTGSGYEYEL